MKKFLLSIIYCLMAVLAVQAQTMVTDIITNELLGVSGSSYVDWAGKTATSAAVYAGKTKKGNTVIQMTNTNHSGIVATASGGKVVSVEVEWNSNTASGRTIDIYGKNTAYTGSAELYGTNAEKGTKLGSIVCGTSTTLAVSGDYEYIGIRSNSGAFYLNKITIVWQVAAEGGDTPDTPETPEEVSVASVADALDAYAEGASISDPISGYIVGYVNSTTVGASGKNCVFGATAEKSTNVLIADNVAETDYTKCLVVELPSGNVRTALNLMDNPGNYKKKVVITGASVEKYYGSAGLKGANVKGTGIYSTVSGAGYSTLFLGYDAVIPSTVEAYTISAIENGYVGLALVDGKLPAGTAVVLKGEGEHFFEIASTVKDIDKGLLCGSLVATEIPAAGNSYYVLACVDGKTGFYKDACEGGVFFNNAGKAYLVIEGVQNAVSYGFDFGGTTGVEAVELAQDNVIYDITGRKVAAITAPGIYIVNGKKVIK